MQTRYQYLLRFLLLGSDLLLLNICYLISVTLLSRYEIFPGLLNRNHTLIFTINILWLLSANVCQLYQGVAFYKHANIYGTTLKSLFLFAGAFFIYLSIYQNGPDSAYLLFSFYGLTALSLLISRIIGSVINATLKNYFSINKSVAVLNINNDGHLLGAYLQRRFKFNFPGFVYNESFFVDKDGAITTLSDQFRMADSQGVEEFFMPLPPNRVRDMPKRGSEARKPGVRLGFVPAYDMGSPELEIEQIEGFPVISLRKEPLDDVKNQFIKRAFDIIFSGLVTVFILSWLCPLIALIIKLESSGPVIFKQLRTGKDNKPFVCYKFRTLRTGNYDEKKQVSANDDRVTLFGNFLRRTSLDELPQFFNVLLGNMSVIGPRPHMIEHTEHYAAVIDGYMVRQMLKPGITGWAQVNGFRGPTNEVYLMQKRVEHDIWYKENWTVVVDLRIVLMTIVNMVKGEKNAY